MQTPTDRLQKHQLILIDFQRVQARNLAPGPGRVVTVLQILRGQDQRRQKHTTTALHGPHHRLITGLFLCEVMGRHMRLNLN
jgi:hypothetical protein